MHEKVTMDSNVRLTQYSHGAGCGCKIAPAVLDEILSSAGESQRIFKSLLVGNAEKDDAAVMDLGDGTAIISTTDFFMPIVDDPFVFGKIAATNAISDVYAMGGTPMMAIAILGWPVNVLGPEIAGEVVRGAKSTCEEAGIPLAGGHSIDSPEPIFGLAVTGRVNVNHIKKNGGAVPGDVLFLTKPLGIGILTTAQKKGKLLEAHATLAPELMMRLNAIGSSLGAMPDVHAMTDVTGFGLAGHLLEMCQASNCHAELIFDQLPVIDPSIDDYIQGGCVPGGTERNFASYGHDLDLAKSGYKSLVCDPQTSGGLLIAAAPGATALIKELLHQGNWYAEPIGHFTAPGKRATVSIV